MSLHSILFRVLNVCMYFPFQMYWHFVSRRTYYVNVFCFAAYYQIYGQLKVRLDQKMRQLQINATPASNGGPARPSTAHSNIIDRIESDIGRMRRTIHLLISVGLVFCVCWLPLNIVNTVSTTKFCNLCLFYGKYVFNYYCKYFLLYRVCRENDYNYCTVFVIIFTTHRVVYFSHCNKRKIATC